MNTIREAFLRMQAGQIDADTFLAIVEQDVFTIEKLRDSWRSMSNINSALVEHLKDSNSKLKTKNNSLIAQIVITPEMLEEVHKTATLKYKQQQPDGDCWIDIYCDELTTTLQKRARGEE